MTHLPRSSNTFVDIVFLCLQQWKRTYLVIVLMLHFMNNKELVANTFVVFMLIAFRTKMVVIVASVEFIRVILFPTYAAVGYFCVFWHHNIRIVVSKTVITRENFDVRVSMKLSFHICQNTNKTFDANDNILTHGSLSPYVLDVYTLRF